MADISIQFHATPDELLTFIEEILHEFRLHVALMRFFPFEVKQIEIPELRRFFQTAPEYRRWLFSVNALVLDVANELAFRDKNPDHLRLDVGRQTEKGLEQSWLTARTEQQDALKLWRKIATRLKNKTSQGVTAINPITRASSRMKSFRYTKGAQSLESAGVAILPFAGTAQLRLDRS